METLERHERWKVDPEHSRLSFTLRHALLGEIRGYFRCWDGHLLVDRADPTRSSVRIWVDLSSIDTGSRQLDDDILDTELFDVGGEPALVFDSERIEMDRPRHARVMGWLALRSYRKEIEVSVEASPPPRDAEVGARFVGAARASIDRRAFGLRRKTRIGDWLSEQMVGGTIEIEAHLEATRDDSARISIPHEDRRFCGRAVEPRNPCMGVTVRPAAVRAVAGCPTMA